MVNAIAGATKSPLTETASTILPQHTRTGNEQRRYSYGARSTPRNDLWVSFEEFLRGLSNSKSNAGAVTQIRCVVSYSPCSLRYMPKIMEEEFGSDIRSGKL